MGKFRGDYGGAAGQVKASGRRGPATERPDASGRPGDRDPQRQVEEARRPTPQPPTAPAIVLHAQGTRDSGETPELNLPAGVDRVVIAVPLPRAQHASYQAVVRTAEGALVWEDAGLQAEDASIRLTIPVSVLPPGDYIVTLAGQRRTGPSSELADFYFRVVD